MQPSAAGADVYRRMHIETRTPLELVVLLYDAALARVAEARGAIERNDLPARRDAISRAMAIVAELQNTLDMQVGGDIARSLDALYTYANSALLEASAKRDSKPLDSVETVLTNLRDAWREISVHQRESQS